MLILGLSPFHHHASAVLLQDGVVRAAIENDKLSRSGSLGLPNEAMRFCLESIGASWSDLDAVTVATRPFRAWLRRSSLHAKLFATAPLACAYHEAKEIVNLALELKDMRIVRQKDGIRHKISYFDHHLCHAASAFFLSPFDRSLIITLDEDGDGDSGMISIGQDNEIRTLQRISFPNSIARVYSLVTDLIGLLSHADEPKTQWLSLEGEPEFKTLLLSMLRRPGGFVPRVRPGLIEQGFGKLAFSKSFLQKAGLSTDPQQLKDMQRRALASSIQAACAELVSDLAHRLRRQHKMTHVCFAGGLFQNALLVAALEKNLGTDELFVPPAPGNAGTALGAVLVAWHQQRGKSRDRGVTHVYWGPKFTGQQAKDVLDNSKARYSVQNTQDRKLDAAVQLLLAGKVVGWVQGACEFGPRALGNRSVLASPWAPYVKENLNDFIKFREWFRPFAISVPEEYCSQYFECSQLCRFMTSLGSIRTSASILPKSFRLPGDRVRLHMVNEQSNPLFWRLLKRFGKYAPAPMLLNTSFNLFGDPLVVSPRDALRSYFCSGIDALVLDNFLLSKTRSVVASQAVSEIRMAVDA
jgi:carbamoyltransferase